MQDAERVLVGIYALNCGVGGAGRPLGRSVREALGSIALEFKGAMGLGRQPWADRSVVLVVAEAEGGYEIQQAVGRVRREGGPKTDPWPLPELGVP